ncbi:MAG: uroporphyrinogen decarboxylase, partial [Bacillus sp. (in: Bacteria)]|nr:uroporphyrinogen decarboxylase [Bacillus sp. (in: firmicutes)]
ITYIRAQVKAGISAFQIFDSWVGALNAADYRTFIKPVMQRIFTELKSENVPMIMYGVGASHLAKDWHDLPLDVVGLDWRMSVDEARKEGLTKTLQGNLDPTILLAPWEVIEERAKDILDQGMKSDHFIFNLGHGVFPDVSPDTLKKLTDFIHDYSAKHKKSSI